MSTRPAQLLYHHPLFLEAAQLELLILSLSLSGVENFIPLSEEK